MDGYYGEPAPGSSDYMVPMAPVEATVEAVAAPYAAPVPDELPTPLVYDQGAPTQSRYEARRDVPAEVTAIPKKGLRLRRRRPPQPRQQSAAQTQPLQQPVGQPYPGMAQGETIVTSPYPPGYTPDAPPQQQWSQWDSGYVPEIIRPTADPAPASQPNGSNGGMVYDKYLDVTSTYQFEQNQQQNANREPEPQQTQSQRYQEDAPREQQDSPSSAKQEREEPKQQAERRQEEATPDAAPRRRQEEAPEQNRPRDKAQDEQEERNAPPARQQQPEPPQQQQNPQAVQRRQPPPAPTRAEVEDYRQRLELRLLERYNNLPEHAGNVGRVEVVLSKPIEESLDGSRLRAEFDQLVYDPWGRRIPKLEEEYFVVTFAAGGARQVRSDPSVRVGLDHEKSYSEHMPLNADPFANVQKSKAFAPAPKPADKTKKMADWWRPDFPELQ